MRNLECLEGFQSGTIVMVVINEKHWPIKLYRFPGKDVLESALRKYKLLIEAQVMSTLWK